LVHLVLLDHNHDPDHDRDHAHDRDPTHDHDHAPDHDRDHDRDRAHLPDRDRDRGSDATSETILPVHKIATFILTSNKQQSVASILIPKQRLVATCYFC
jgi:ABC-type nickel/cobalt efflux system permease component RcnA